MSHDPQDAAVAAALGIPLDPPGNTDGGAGHHEPNPATRSQTAVEGAAFLATLLGEQDED